MCNIVVVVEILVVVVLYSRSPTWIIQQTTSLIYTENTKNE